MSVDPLALGPKPEESGCGEPLAFARSRYELIGARDPGDDTDKSPSQVARPAGA
jgi:hypothetical protein